jgi:hypothetical protein
MARTKAECGRLGGLATLRGHGTRHTWAIGRNGFNAPVARHWQGDRAGFMAWLREHARFALVEAAAEVLLDAGETCVELDGYVPGFNDDIPF